VFNLIVLREFQHGDTQGAAGADKGDHDMIQADKKNDSAQAGFSYCIYDGPERRSGLERRTGSDRRGSLGAGQLALPFFQRQYDLGFDN
jgi:hypothetical protein